MENNRIHTDKEASAALKQKALPYLPRNLGDVTAQKQILTMIVQVAPAVASYAAEADRTLWADVANAKLPINHAIAQCAYQTNHHLGSGTAHSANLHSLPEDTLLKAWIALDYYTYVLKEEYTRNLRYLQQQIAEVLLTPGSSHAQNHPAANAFEVLPETLIVSEAPDLEEPQTKLKKREKPGKNENVIKGDNISNIEQSGKKEKKQKAPKQDHKAEASGKAKKDKAVSGQKSGRKGTMIIAIAVSAVLVLVISLTAAFLFSDTRKTEASINNIGTVTLESEKSILKAEELYAALTESQQAKIDNRNVLFSARAEYDSLVAEAAIDAIGKVTLESNAAITHAEEVYEALSRDAKNLVDNYKTLTAARKEYERLDTAVANASAAIDAIGKVSLDSSKKIEEARAAYDALAKDDLQKYLEDKASTLKIAEKEYRRLVSQDLYDTGISHSENQRYDEAIACFDTIIAEYSDTSVARSARESRAECQIALAEQAYGKRDYYTAMKALNAVEAAYHSLDSYRQVRDNVTRSLNSTRPSNSASIDGYLSWGQCYFNITAPDQDICLKIQNTSDSTKYKLVYIRAGQTAKINVADGTYVLKWVTGEYWYGKEHMFGDEGQYKSLYTVTFTTTRSGNWIHYQYLELDLADTSLFPSSIKADEF